MDIADRTAQDYEFSYCDRLGRRATHRIRVFVPGAWTTVLVTDLSEKYRCPSVTNSLEELIEAFLNSHPEIRIERLVVIEHYDDRPSWRPAIAGTVPPAKSETFDLVSFRFGSDGHMCDPSWKRVTKREAEQWVGATLP